MERQLYKAHPAMFRNAPLRFLLCILLIGVYGLGFLLLIGWYFYVSETTLIITNQKIILEKGFWFKKTHIIPYHNAMDILIFQTFLERIMGVGTVKIYSGATNQSIEIKGIPNPSKIKRLLKYP
jgi:membrane protein YdbS with pleckstrin-like domain